MQRNVRRDESVGEGWSGNALGLHQIRVDYERGAVFDFDSQYGRDGGDRNLLTVSLTCLVR